MAFIDWSVQESARAKMRVAVKRLLRQFGYPPDLEAAATKTVVQQAEWLAGDGDSQTKGQQTSYINILIRVTA